MSNQRSLKQQLLRTLIGALVLTALIAVVVFLFGDFGETEIKLLLTTLSVSYFSITALACAAAREANKSVFPATAGMVTSAIGFVHYLPCVWAEWWDNEACSKTVVILAIFAFAFAQTCLLSLAPLQKRYQWVFVAAVICIFALAVVLSAMIVGEAHEEWMFRVVGVLGVLDGCASLSIPVLCKLGSGLPVRVTERHYWQIELVCPRCGHRGVYSNGEIECEECLLRLRIELCEEPADTGPGDS